MTDKTTFATLNIKGLIILCSLFTLQAMGQIKEVPLPDFDKVIVSPHIAVNFVAAAVPKVTVHSSKEPLSKLTIEVVGSTLRLYLEGAKTYTDNEKIKGDQYDYRVPIYKGTVVTATVSYTQLQGLSLRGEETFRHEGTLSADEFTLSIFGEAQVYLDAVAFNSIKTRIYGESYLELKKGNIGRQKITAYGETTVNTLGVSTQSAKITAYGEGSYRLSVAEKLKVSAFGEATVAYKGSPTVRKGMVFGEAVIQQID